MPLPHNLRCPVDPASPQPVGVCDRCGFLVYHSDLQDQKKWFGNSLTSTGILVHPNCLDKPNETLRTATLGPEGMGPKNPRPPSWAAQNLGGEDPPTVAQIVDGE